METQAINEIIEQLSQSENINFARPRKFDANGEIIESPPLTSLEKKQKLIDLLTNDPAIFLEKYANLLTTTQLENIWSMEALQNNNEVLYFQKLYAQSQVTAQQNTHKETSIRNRRFKYMEEVLNNTDYFSEENMKIRAPVLYHQYIGQYKKTSSDQVNAWSKPFDKNSKLYDRLLLNYDLCQADDTIQDQMQEEESDEEEEEDEEEETEKDQKAEPSKEEVKEGNGVLNGEATGVDKEEMDEESSHYDFEDFIKMMKENFLAGRDHEFFDYAKVDKDDSLDDMKEVEREAEERYFEEDDD